MKSNIEKNLNTINSGEFFLEQFDQEENISFLIIGSKRFKKSTVNSMIEEAKKNFSKVLFVTIDKIQIQTSDLGVGLFYKGKNLLEYDAIYPRFSSSDFLLGEAVLKAIEQSTAYCPVNLSAFQITNHKFYTAQKLSRVGVPGVLSTLFISPKYSKLAVKETGFPFVMKLISGFAGKGVVLVRDPNQMNSILDAVHLFEEFICTQQFVKSKKPGTDVRCYVIGDFILSVKRTSVKGDWRSNLSRGGSAKLINPTPALLDAAKKSAKVLGVDLCAVDLMDKNGKWVVIEVNFMPGPFMKYLGNMVIQEWIKYIKRKVLIKKRKEKELFEEKEINDKSSDLNLIENK
ncbi:MAG: ATP-grasp domain-containing protein [Candidatus ainarchaeum sp.]|nr:ATP-grasp domain-containing protein [Candidatus ainarchaeum sp.]